MENKEKMRRCDCCGTEIHNEEFIEFDGQILCPRCFDRETVLCSHCGDRIWHNDNAGNSYTALCQDCYDDHYTNCERCGCLIREDYANYINDTPYCDDCYESEKDHPIHDYSYKPDPIFNGSGNRFFGVELEIDDGGKDDDNAETLLEIGNVSGEKIYIKSDGSLDDGMEIVTHPMSLEFHKEKMPWEEIMETAILFGYKSHKTRTCGLHVHVKRYHSRHRDNNQLQCVHDIIEIIMPKSLESEREAIIDIIKSALMKFSTKIIRDGRCFDNQNTFDFGKIAYPTYKKEM